MRELFGDLDEDGKQNIYQQLEEYVKNDNLDAMQDILKNKINLSYKLKNFSSEEKIYIDDYLNSPLGLALYKDKKILKELLTNCYLGDLESHGPVYLYLAAKEGNDNSVFFAQQLIELFFKNNAKLDLDFVVNDKILDSDVIGKKDFIEVAIENNQEVFMNWVLDKKFIETEIFVVKIKHIQSAIKNLTVNILKQLLLNNKIPLTKLMQALENKFLYATVELSYLEYIEKFKFDLYNTIGEIFFNQAVKELNLPVILWLLKKGFFFEVKNTFSMINVLTDLQRKYPEEQLLFIGMHYKNYELIKILLQSGKLSIDNLIQYHIQSDLGIDVKLFESISNHLNKFLAESNNCKTWIDLFRVADKSLYYRLFKLLATLKQQDFSLVVQEMFQQNIKSIVLQTFLEIVKYEDGEMLNKFLLLPSSCKEFVLNGDDQQTALSIACENKYLESIKSLLPHMNILQINKSLNKNNCYKNITALWITLAFQFLEGAECLLNIPGIEINNGKGEHYNFRSNMSVSCKELNFLCEKEEQKKIVGLYTLYNNTIASNEVPIKDLMKEKTVELKDVQLNDVQSDNEEQIDFDSKSSNAKLVCSL